MFQMSRPAALNFLHTQASVTSWTRPEDNSTGLNLGVGYNSIVENRTNEQNPACYSIVNGGLNLHGNRENAVEAHKFQTHPIHPFHQCPQNLGRVIMGLHM